MASVPFVVGADVGADAAAVGPEVDVESVEVASSSAFAFAFGVVADRPAVCLVLHREIRLTFLLEVLLVLLLLLGLLTPCLP